MKRLLKLFSILILLFLPCNAVFSQGFSVGSNEDGSDNSCQIDYFGVISNDLDINMSTMLSDLYFTQLSEIPNFVVFDKRITPINVKPSDAEIKQTENTVFYTEIMKNGSEETWTLTYIVTDKIQKKQFSKKKKYDSFYKILMESKNELETSIKALIAQGEDSSGQNGNNNDNFSSSAYGDDFLSGDIFNDEYSSSHNDKKQTFSSDSSEGIKNNGNTSKKRLAIKSVEMLSGTWTGDSSIDKIVILRGGRGFVIFKNGASMNINITIEENNGDQIISIKQKGNSNASFYPDLPRKIALVAAVSAPPIEWSMVLLENMVMEGTKTTLIQDNESFTITEVPVVWKKVN